VEVWAGENTAQKNKQKVTVHITANRREKSNNGLRKERPVNLMVPGEPGREECSGRRWESTADQGLHHRNFSRRAF
jgi:hypothetical protein